MRLSHSYGISAGIIGLVLTLALSVHAQDMAAASPAAATGSWKWSMPGRNGDQEMTLTLKQDGEKVTGTLGAGERQSDITDGTFKDGQLSFKVSREFNGQTMVTTYTGTITGDTLKAKSEATTTREITATRSK